MPHGHRLTLRVVTAAVLAAVGLACAPGRAAAGCGDYVTVAGQSPHADETAPSAPPRPCHGPGCSNRPVDPPPLTAPAADPAGPQDPVADTGHDHPDPPAAGRTARLAAHDPVTRPGRPVYHPPRGS